MINKYILKIVNIIIHQKNHDKTLLYTHSNKLSDRQYQLLVRLWSSSNIHTMLEKRP